MIPSLAKTRISLLALLLIFTHFSFSKDTSGWIEESNNQAKILLEVNAKRYPEYSGKLGVEGLDEEIIDYNPGFRDRYIEDLTNVKAYYESTLASSKPGPLQQDLKILLLEVNNSLLGEKLYSEHMLPYENVTNLIYFGIRSLLEERIPEDRRKLALVRLKKYVGSIEGYSPTTELYTEYLKKEWENSDRLPPFKEEVERNLNINKKFLKEIGALFEQYNIKGYKKHYEKLLEQAEEFDKFVQSEILPKARTDFKLPRAVYEYNLKEFGVDMPIEDLSNRAMVSFKELQTQLQVLANQIADKHKFPSNDYRDVIKQLKKEQFDSASTLPFYQQTIRQLEDIIVREQIVTLPERDMVIRLATEAESAAAPAPFMSPPRLIGNTGEYGEFVLPLNVSGGSDGRSLKIDDFTHKAAAWPLTAHEGRPGHELQFTSLVENGVSQTRAIFAQNSVNIEGWALYSEELMLPYLPLEGQFMTLWSRLMRSVRAFLDPGLNLGLITVEEARYILSHEIVLSEALTRSELERYRFRMPGQAVSYFNGYVRLMEIRAEAELILGEYFDLLSFNDFILTQGLLPPALIKEAVMNEYIPQFQEK